MNNNINKNKSGKHILTIAIPTYNRSKYLDLCLAQICKQLPGNEQSVELIVSDNNSTDNTEGIVKKYISRGCNIKYIKNKENIGPDKNFIQCYNEANGKYVLLFGDDDILTDNAIERILRVLRQDDYGIVYLKGAGKRFSAKTTKGQNCKYTVYNDNKDFIKNIYFYLTFISGNIFNKSMVTVDIQEFAGTYLIQLGWTLSAALNARRNVIIEDIILAANLAGTGERLLCNIFGINQNKIFDIFIKRGANKKLFEIINRKLLQLYFPPNIISIRKEKTSEIKGKNKFIDEDFYRTLYPIYHKYLSFWIFTVPVIKLPILASEIWFLGTTIIRKLPEIPGFFIKLGLRILTEYK